MKFYSKEKFKRLPNAVLFDMDNTLYDYTPAHIFSQNVIKSKIIKRFSITGKHFDQIFFEARKQVKENLGDTASSHSRLLYLQRMIELMGFGTQPLLALDFEQTYWRTFLEHATLFDGVKELLDDFRLLNIPMGIVTNLTARIQFRKILYFGLDHYIDHIVSSEEAGHDKPHEAPFKMILDKISPKGDCTWMIGDHPIHDIQGGRESINAITLQKTHTAIKLDSHSANLPDALFKEYSELRKFVKQLGKI